MTDAACKRAFVTGATGAVGETLVRQLLDRGWRVTAFHRATSNVDALKALGVDLATGDLTSAKDAMRAIPQDADAVFHLAADLSLWSKRNEAQFETNVIGTRNIVNAALHNRARRFIHTSTISAYGRPGTPISETTPSVAGASHVGYERTKWLAEEEVRDGVRRGLDAVIVNPCAVMGPGIRTGWAMIFRQIKSGAMKALPSGDVVVNHIDDVAAALISAYERGRCGENYILTGDTVSFAELIREAASLSGVGLTAPTVGPNMLAFVGALSGFVSRFTGKEPDMTPEMAALMSQKLACATTKAQQELGYRAKPWRRCIAEMRDWLHARGEL